MAESEKRKQVTVVGGGPGGYAAAFLAADLDMDVTLIDDAVNPGGVCLYRGCIPSKALLHIARLIEEARDAKAHGVTFNKPDIDLDRLREWKDSVVQKLTGGLGQISKLRKVNYLRGTARFTEPHSLEIRGIDGDRRKHDFEHAIIATGSSPVTIPELSPGSERVMNSTDALNLRDIPKSLLVVGGGYIGLEIGSVYAALGSKVTVVEMTPGLLPGVDRDLVSVLRKRLEGKFEAIFLNTTVKSIKEQKNGLKVVLEGEGIEEKTRLFEKALIAVGRRPNSADIGLDNLEIETDKRGFIKVDDRRSTAQKHIYAVGDVAGEPMLAHKASHEGKTAVEVIAGKDVVFRPRAIPAVVFTDPEVAWCGLTETEAGRQEMKIESARFPWGASGRAATLGRSDGVTKMIIDPETGRVLGVGIVGPGAGELIAEAVLGVEMAAVIDDVRLSIHPHPTLSETIMEAADLFYGQSTDYYRPKKK